MSAPSRRFGELPLEAMSPEQRAVADAIMAGPRSMGGALRGPFEAMLRSPGLAESAQRVGEHVRYHSVLPARLNELAIIMVARRWTAQYEWSAHKRLALAAGLDPVVVDAIADGRAPALGDDPDALAVHRFVAQLLAEGQVDDEAFADVDRRFGQQGAMDLIGAVGYYCLISFILNVDRVPLPEGEEPLRPL